MRIGKWKKAVERSYGWVKPKKDMEMTGNFFLVFLPFFSFLYLFLKKTFRGTLQDAQLPPLYVIHVFIILHARSFGNSGQTVISLCILP